MTPQEFLIKLDQEGTGLKLSEGRLLGPKTLAQADREFIVFCKDELIESLKSAERVACPGEGCNETIRLYEGRGWCPNHRMKVRYV